MQLTQEQLWSYTEWLFTHNAWLPGVALAISLTVLGLIVSYVVALVQFGPGEGFYAVARVIRDFFVRDLPGTRFSRLFAIASWRLWKPSAAKSLS